MRVDLRANPTVTTRESALPECAQQRLVKIKLAVDDAEANRANIMKRLSALRPDESLERAALERKRIANDKLLSNARGLATRVDEFLKKSGVLDHVSPTKVTVAPYLRPEEAQWGSIENFRRKVQHIKSEMIDIRRAPLPFAQIEAALKTTVATWAMEGRPHIKINDVKGHVEVGFGLHVPKPHKIAAWADPQAMLAKLVAQAKKQLESKRAPMTPEQKAERLQSLKDALYETERREIAMIDAFIERGEPGVFHRLDIDPAALLGIRVPSWAIVEKEGLTPVGDTFAA
jgi:hypothetical protein